MDEKSTNKAIDEMTSSFSTLSRQTFSNIFDRKIAFGTIRESLPAHEAIRYLKTELPIRRFNEWLKKTLSDKGLSREEFVRLLDEAEVKASHASHNTSVNNWLEGSHRPSRKNLCLAGAVLGFTDASEYDELFYHYSDDGCAFHLRNLWELCFYYALHKENVGTELYKYACELYEKAAECTKDSDGATDIQKNTVLLENSLRKNNEEILRGSEEAFLAFCKENATQFGDDFRTLSETYAELMKEFFIADTEDLAIGAAPSHTGALSPVQKHLPITRDNISKQLKAGKVSRKSFITLYILNYEFLIEDGAILGAESDDSSFAEVYNDLNDKLTSLNLAPLDPRNPFDWIVLLALRVPTPLNDDEAEIDIIRDRLKILVEEALKVEVTE